MLDYNLQNILLANATTDYITRIQVRGLGGKICLTKVHDDVAAYWKDQNPASFGTHIVMLGLNVEQKLDGSRINPLRSSEGWTDICDAVFDGGIEMEGTVEIEIFDEHDQQILSFRQHTGEPSWPVRMIDDQRFFEFEQGHNYVCARTFDWVCSSFLVRSQRPFDPDLMDLNIFQTGWGNFIHSISYDEEVIEVEDQVWMTMQSPKATILQKGSN